MLPVGITLGCTLGVEMNLLGEAEMKGQAVGLPDGKVDLEGARLSRIEGFNEELG